jgi:hypothetical protein
LFVMPPPSPDPVEQRQTCGRLLRAWLSYRSMLVCAFDPELVPEALRPWVLDVAERLQVPADYPAATLLVVLAGALGRTRVHDRSKLRN